MSVYTHTHTHTQARKIESEQTEGTGAGLWGGGELSDTLVNYSKASTQSNTVEHRIQEPRRPGPLIALSPFPIDVCLYGCLPVSVCV